jgi:hypothetical protein
MKTLTALAIAALTLLSAPLAHADDPSQWTINPPNPCCNPGPYADPQQAWNQAIEQQRQTGQYPSVQDQYGNYPPGPLTYPPTPQGN